MTEPDVSELLAVYNEELRGRTPDRLAEGETLERDGPLLRFAGAVDRGFITYRDLDGLDGDELDQLIARQVDVFAARGEPFEWKLHGHDLPADLPARLRAAGFVPEDEETVVIALVGAIAGEPVLPREVSIREVTDRRDLERIEALEEAVWGEPHRWVANKLESELALDPDGLSVVVAEAGDEVVCAAWVRFERGTPFATLWGGSTLPAWRRRGIYRAVVAYRAGLAARHGYRYVEVDAGDESRPILERLGFVPVTTTTPYIWRP